MRVIARYTCKEFLRKKILPLVIALALLVFFGSIIAGQLALSEQVKVMQDMMFTTMEIAWLIVTLFFGSQLLSQEISQGTIFLLLSKKSNRTAVLLGKYCGFALVLLLLRVILALAFVGVSFLYHIPRQSTYVYILLGIYLSRIVVLAMVLFFSTFVSSFVALFSSLVLYLLGHTMAFVIYYVSVLKTDYFSPLFVGFMKTIYYIIPNFTAMSFYEFQDVPGLSAIVPSQFLGGAALAVVYIVLLLTMAIAIMRKKSL